VSGYVSVPVFLIVTGILFIAWMIAESKAQYYARWCIDLAKNPAPLEPGKVTQEGE
jgi:hypothetical protein